MASGEKLQLLLTAKDMTRGAFGTFNRGLSAARRAVFSFKSGLTALVGVAGLGLLVKKTLETVDANKKLADRMGLSTKQLGGYELAATLAGESITTVQKALEKMEKNLGETEMGLSTAKLGVDALGLELEKINRLSPDERFKRIADGIAALSTQQEKNVVATQLFGKAGAKMIQVFEMGSKKLTEMQDAAEELGISLNEFASAQIEKFNDRLAILILHAKGIFRTFVVALIPAMTKVVDITFKWLKAWNEDGGPTKAAAAVANFVLDIGHGILTMTENMLKFGKFTAEAFNRLPPWLRGDTTVGQGFFDGITKGLADVEKGRATLVGLAKDVDTILSTTSEEAADINKRLGLDETTEKSILTTNALTKMADAMKSFDDQVTDTAALSLKELGKTFEQIIMGAKSVGDAFKDLGRTIYAALVNMFVTQAIINPLVKPFESLFGGGGASVSATTGGSHLSLGPRAAGGPVMAGRSYLVGENGPEMLTMGNSPGMITPNRGVGVNQTINISAGVAQTVRAEIMALLPAIAQASNGQLIDKQQRGGS
jgi:transcriptional regulator with XRE-family HTH domain